METMIFNEQLLKEYFQNDELVNEWVAEFMRGGPSVIAELTECCEQKPLNDYEIVNELLVLLQEVPLIPMPTMPFYKEIGNGFVAFKGEFYSKSVSFHVVTNDETIKKQLILAIVENTNSELYQIVMKFEKMM